MDRLIVYPGEIPLDTDLLTAQKYAKAALGRALALAYGPNQVACQGLAITFGGGLSVTIAPGSIIAPSVTDGTAFGSLAADSTPIQNQYISPVYLNLAVPTTPGSYGVYAVCQEADDTPVLSYFFNSNNPSQTYAGPGNSGTSTNSRRSGKISFVCSSTPPATPANGLVIAIGIVTYTAGTTVLLAANIISGNSGYFFQTIPQLCTPTPLMGTATYNNGTVTNQIVPPLVQKCHIGFVGAGGSGGTADSNQGGAGGGGGGGGFEIEALVNPGDTISFSIGTGGAAVSGTGVTGNPGGSSSVTINGVTFVGGGGGPGLSKSSTQNIASGGGGGTTTYSGTPNYSNIQFLPYSGGWGSDGIPAVGGQAGSSWMGPGTGRAATTGNTTSPYSWGAGSSGGYGAGSQNSASGNPGVIRIRWLKV